MWEDWIIVQTGSMNETYYLAWRWRNLEGNISYEEVNNEQEIFCKVRRIVIK